LVAHCQGRLLSFLYSRHVPLWEIGVFLSYTPRRVICTLCGSIHVEAMHWVSGKRQFTRTLWVTLAT